MSASAKFRKVEGLPSEVRCITASTAASAIIGSSFLRIIVNIYVSRREYWNYRIRLTSSRSMSFEAKEDPEREIT